MFLCILIIAFVIYLDQLSKWLAVVFLRGGDSVPVIKDVFQLTYVENKGAAFGMFSEQRWLFMTASAVAIICLFVYIAVKKPKSIIIRTSLSMIIGGGIGNMIDRFLLGYVVDFFDFSLINFAVFNVADSFVCVGTGILMLYIIITTIQDIKGAKKDEIGKREDKKRSLKRKA